MNGFLSLARSFWNALGFSKKSAGDEGHSPAAAPKARAYRSAFASGGRGDGFDGGARGRPVDLTGGVKLNYEVLEEPVPAPAPVQSDFVASLDDLGLLVEDQAPDPQRTDAPSVAASEPLAAFEPLDAFESAPPVAAELPEAVTAPEQPGAVEQPVVAAVAQPSVAAPQYTVQLLMPAARERAVPSEAVDQFSTLELLDTVAQLSPAEDAVKQEEAVRPGPAPEPPAGSTGSG